MIRTRQHFTFLHLAVLLWSHTTAASRQLQENPVSPAPLHLSIASVHNNLIYYDPSAVSESNVQAYLNVTALLYTAEARSPSSSSSTTQETSWGEVYRNIELQMGDLGLITVGSRVNETHVCFDTPVGLSEAMVASQASEDDDGLLLMAALGRNKVIQDWQSHAACLIPANEVGDEPSVCPPNWALAVTFLEQDEHHDGLLLYRTTTVEMEQELGEELSYARSNPEVEDTSRILRTRTAYGQANPFILTNDLVEQIHARLVERNSTRVVKGPIDALFSSPQNSQTPPATRQCEARSFHHRGEGHLSSSTTTMFADDPSAASTIWPPLLTLSVLAVTALLLLMMSC